MEKQYLHLSAYPCDECASPVIGGWLGVRENQISKETKLGQVGATCISCGHRQSAATEPARASFNAAGMGFSGVVGLPTNARGFSRRTRSRRTSLNEPRNCRDSN